MSKLKLILFPAIPFIISIVGYFYFSYQRQLENLNDPLAPSFYQLYEALKWVFSSDTISGKPIIYSDFSASIYRLLFGVILSSVCAMSFAIALNVSINFNRVFKLYFVMLTQIPMAALLPIIVVWFGVGEASKVIFLFIGIWPLMVAQIYEHLNRNTKQLETRLLSLRLPLSHDLYYVRIPLAFRHTLEAVRQNLVTAWLFLLVGETFGASSGLGYRMFVLQKFLRMDVILIYTFIIAITSIGIYFVLGRVIKAYRWKWI